MTDLEDIQERLLEEFSENLDSSAVLAILSDYNLSNPAELEAARQLLRALSSDVATEEATGFDPSGSSRPNLLTSDLGSGREDDESVSARSQQAWRSETDGTSLSQELSALDLEGLEFSDSGGATSRDESPEKPLNSELDGLDERGKEAALVSIFPALKPFDIKWTLKKCKGDAGLAIDELMTQSFLEESGSRHRGIEAFYDNGLSSRQRKAKGKKRRGRTTKEDAELTELNPASPLQSKWDLGRQDVEFLASKTGMPMQQVSSMYHKNSGSIRTTIAAIVDAHASLKMESDDPMIQINASELRQDFPSISTSDLESLVQLTYPSTSNARELAKALTSRPIDSKPSIQLEFRRAPVDLSSDSTTIKPKLSNGVYREGSMSATELASTFSKARDTAYIQAHAAYRKGKSDPLMGGAAAYYSQLGREHDARTKSAESAAADAMVSMQNSRTELDLHGVNVKDAVRISREKVTTWWHELNEQRVGTIDTRRIGEGYQIITGKGNHSDGKGKLGPAVGKMLIREGWKVEVRGGRLVVMGVANKR
ncbi:hypothetical protein L207DRAFT_495512 [Hyaloscypha variabilis F]|uniref:Smr domain-containing protein n=1 Tax=Hyaloscypha variabilis (strain UAMH 11265 / GT02V1 / F) TaxID=1149755 RepID=A0A2J6R9T4_HYAVF|nr:hypothetical protein L207DRAFT_495512 [Hyaloscypha variabilis F]